MVAASGLSGLSEREFGPMCLQGARAPLFPPPRAETGMAVAQESWSGSCGERQRSTNQSAVFP